MPKKPRHSDEEFLRAWRQCESKAQLARRLGLTEGEVRRRERKLLSEGVALPRMEVCA